MTAEFKSTKLIGVADMSEPTEGFDNRSGPVEPPFTIYTDWLGDVPP